MITAFLFIWIFIGIVVALLKSVHYRTKLSSLGFEEFFFATIVAMMVVVLGPLMAYIDEILDLFLDDEPTNQDW